MFMVVKSVRKKSTKNDLDLIPGPRKLPLIGNLHLLAGNSSPLHHVFKDLATKCGPILRLQLGEIPFIIVSSVEVAEQVLKTHDQIFANRPDLGCLAKAVTYDFTNIGLSPYGEYWRYLRKICTLELLSMRRVKSFKPVREEENMNLCEWIASMEGSPANLSEQVYLSSFNITTRAAVGNKTEDQETITSALKEVMKMHSGFNIADLYPSVKYLSLISGAKAKTDRLFQQTDRVFDIVINQHREAIANRTNDDATERSEDLADVLLKLVIKETLRLHPPLPLIVPRENSEACEVNGYKLPFGAGRRICPGMSFGMANVEFPVAMLLYHFDWGMPNGIKNEELDMADDSGFSAKRKHDLLLIPFFIINEYSSSPHSLISFSVPIMVSKACFFSVDLLRRYLLYIEHPITFVPPHISEN